MADAAEFLLQQFRLLISDGSHDHEAYNFFRNNLLALVNARAMRVGHVPRIHIGQMFLYRFELVITGLHTHQVRGICIGRNNGVDIATCVVAKCPLHNLDVGNNYYHYGGQGGEIAKANRVNMRVSEDQEMSEENWALYQCIQNRSPVRLVIGNIKEPYVYYQGLYMVREMNRIRTLEGLLVFEYLLQRAAEQV